MSATSRGELAVTGVALIGSVFVLPEYAAVSSLLALSGVFPAISALIGEDLLQSVVRPYQQPAIPRVEQTSPAAEQRKAAAITAIDEVRKSKERKTAHKAA